MKFVVNNAQKTPLCVAIEKENVDVVKRLLEESDIDVNVKSILKNIYLF